MSTHRNLASCRGIPIHHPGFTLQLGYGVLPGQRWLELTDPDLDNCPWSSTDTFNWLLCYRDDEAPTPCSFVPELRNGSGEDIVEIRYRADAPGSELMDELMGTGSYLRARRVRLRQVPHRGGAITVLDVAADIGLNLTYPADEDLAAVAEEHWDEFDEGDQ